MAPLLVVLALAALLGVAGALRAPLPRPLRALLRSNKVDSLPIDGALTPLANNLLIQVKEVASSTAGGIYIPDNAKERPTEGTVVATGPGRTHPDTAIMQATVVAPGDKVIYGKYDGTELKYNDASHQLIKDDDVLLKYRGAQATLDAVECVKDKVLVRLIAKEEKTQSGLIVSAPSNKEKKTGSGTVVKVGPGRQASNGQVVPLPVRPGNGVRFREYSGTEVKIEGVEYIVVPAHDILAKW